MSPETVGTIIGTAIATASAVLGLPHGIKRLRAARANGNGSAAPGPNTIRLQERDDDWRRQVDRELFQDTGMVRTRLHLIANTVNGVASRLDVQEVRLIAIEKLGEKLDVRLEEISGQISNLRVELARQDES